MFTCPKIVVLHPERSKKRERKEDVRTNKAGYTAQPVICVWTGVVSKVARVFGQMGRSNKVKDLENDGKKRGGRTGEGIRIEIESGNMGGKSREAQTLWEEER